MCVCFYILEHPIYAAILCSNRDEVLSRPTVPAHFHNFGFPVVVDENEGEVLSGRDVEAGGTWLGITRAGRIALLTNISEAGSSDAHFPSRGALITSFLLNTSSDPPPSLFTSTFAGFNLLLLTPSSPSSSSLSYEAAIASNHGSGGPVLLRSLTDEERRLGGFSNGPDGTEKAGVWKKVERGLELLHEVLEKDGNDETTLVGGLFGLLERVASSSPPLSTTRTEGPCRNRSDLRERILVEPLRLPPPTGGSPKYYATRTSTVLLVRRDGSVLFTERDMWVLDQKGEGEEGSGDDDGPKRGRGDRTFRFHIERKGST